LTGPRPGRWRAAAPATAARVVLAKNLARSIRRGHPWIYRDALRPTVDAIADGALVQLVARDGRPLALGFWDARSPIAVRVLAGLPSLGDALGTDATMVTERARAALDRRLSFLDLARTNAFRWIHGEADRLPGIHVDVYADTATVRFDGAGARAFYRGRDIDALLVETGQAVGLRAVVERGHPAAAPSLREIEVRENGLLFGADLAHGGKGGLFLDQRDNRAAVGALSRGARVLNLFGYTGGFSIYAAAAGAVRTMTVDIARPAIAAARRNFERNQLPTVDAAFHAGDAFEFLEGARRRLEQWDVVVSDPPSFAPSRVALPAARKAYRRLHRLSAGVVAPGGLFCAASCSSHFGRADLLASVEDGARDGGRRFTLVELRGAAPDHPVVPEFPEGDYLKMAIGRVD